MANQKLVNDVVGEVKLKVKKEKKIESNFNMEEWKRTYMNKDPRGESIPYFWKNLDVRVNSIWFADYKHSNELSQELYKTGNFVGGVVQRSQPFNKSIFGVLLITGEETKQHVTCLWVYESKNVPQEIQSEIDYEMFDFKRADWKNDKDKIEAYLAQDKEIDGKKILDKKIFR